MSQKFNFFQTEKLDSVEITEPLFGIQTVDVVASCSYKKTAYFGDSEGGLLYNDRSMNLYRKQIFNHSVNFMYHYTNSDYLIVIGDGPDSRSETKILESKGYITKTRENFKANPEFSQLLDSFHFPTQQQTNSTKESSYTLKIFNTIETKGNVELKLVKSCKLFESDNYVFTCMHVFEVTHDIVLGTTNGKVILLKGDLFSTKSYVPFVIENSSLTDSVTNVILTNYEDGIHSCLYITTLSTIGLYLLSTEGQFTYEYHSITTENGCNLNCAVLTNCTDLIYGQQDGFFIYHYEDPRGCVAIKGEKIYMYTYKNYMVFEYMDEQKKAAINIYNLSQKFFEKSMSFYVGNANEIISTCLSFNNLLFVLTESKRLYKFKEYTIQSKLDYLFEQHLYTTAISLAQLSQQSISVIQNIHKTYGDYLYESSDFEGAIEQYIETIGTVEPSYVIQRYLEASTLEYLTQYLESLHTKKQATVHHTTLLINCYSKLRKDKELHEFIDVKKNKFQFDVKTAIDVLRSSGYYDEAVFLAGNNANYFDEYISIQIIDLKNYKDALNFIHCLPIEFAIGYMEQYGKTFVDNIPDDTLTFLISLCTHYERQQCIHEQINEIRGSSDFEYADPTKFISCFSNTHSLELFLEQLLTIEHEWEDTVYNTIIELYLKQREHLIHSKSTLDEIEDKKEIEDIDNNIVLYEQKIITILKNNEYNYDDEQVLLLVQMYNFKEGQILLYTKKNMLSMILQYYIEKQDTDKVIEFCKEHGEEEKSLWINLLTYFSTMKVLDEKKLQDVLLYIEEHHIMPVLSVLETLSSCNTIALSVVKEYILKELEEAEKKQQNDRVFINKLKKDNESMVQSIISLQTSCKVFQQTKCSNCQDKLDLPTVHFMCGHSFHQRCVADRNEGCPKCNFDKEYSHTRDIQKKQNKEEDYLNDLHNNADGFEVSANYISKGIFQIEEEEAKTPEQKQKEQQLEAKKYSHFDAQNIEEFSF